MPARNLKLRILLLALVMLVSLTSARAQDKNRRADSGEKSYYQKWLNEDAYWIISEDERTVFLKLTTDEERDAFIEQFWARRDPDPETLDNEFKIEHYRRIVYANDTYSAGIAGWKTDRGMTYIKFGPPDRLESYPNGGTYARERHEGGGMTTVFPFERWEYRRIEGVGDDVELEFVDDRGGSLYELTWDKRRKDALLYSGRMGLTQDELDQLKMTGTTSKRDRIMGTREAGELTGYAANTSLFENSKDKPFAQLATSAGINRPPVVKFKDLEAAVTARVSYTGLPFDVKEDFIRITDQQILVPITVLLSNNQMTFREASGIYLAAAQIFGRVVTLGNRIETVFEEEVLREFAAADLVKARQRASIYQKRLILRPGLYKLEIAVKDPESKRVGSIERRLEVPRFDQQGLRLSSLILADRIEPNSKDLSTSNFILGDLKVIPKTDDAFARSGNLGVYLQVYGFAIDEQRQRPSLKLEYAIAAQGAQPDSWRDVSASVHYAGQYCRIARMVSLSRLQAGEHLLFLRIRDNISGQAAAAQAAFRVTN